MAPLRLLLRSHRVAFLLLLACTLAVRMLVPTGFMPVVADGTITVAVCPGAQPVATGTHSMVGMHHDDSGKHGKADMPCVYAGLGQAAVGSVPPALVAAALAFAFLLASQAATRQRWAMPARLRPPLRAPPLTI